MKKLLLFSIFSLGVIFVNAQAINLHAGLINSKLTGSVGGGTARESESKLSWRAGVGFDWKLAANINFMPEVNLLYKGGINKELQSSYNTKLLYMEVPLNIVYNSKSTKGGFFAGAGPSINLGLSGKVKYTDVSQTLDINVKFDGKKNGEDDNYHFKAMEFGLNIFGGYRVTNNLIIEANFNTGLNNIYTGPDIESLKNQYFGLSLAYVLTK